MQIPRAAFLLLVTLVVPDHLLAQRQRDGSNVATDRIFAALGVAEGGTVCEIGAGDGELSVEAARRVGTTGRVYTTELGEERVKRLRANVERSGLAHITVLAGDPQKTNFPEAACDALFMRNVYHHFAEPRLMNGSIAAALKPGGRVAVVDFTPPGTEAERASDRDEDGTHGVAADTVSRELKESGLEPIASEAGGGRWFMVVAAKPGITGA